MRGGTIISAASVFSGFVLALAAPVLTVRPAHGVTLSGGCQASGAMSPAIQGLLSANPDGGAPLAEAIAAAVTAQPDLAQDVVVATRGAAPLVAAAAGQGLASAQIALARSGSGAAASIAGWVACATPTLQAAYDMARAGQLAGGGGWLFGSSTLTTGGVVSPSRP